MLTRIALTLALSFLALGAHGAAARRDGAEGDARLQQLVQQLTSENAALSQTKVQLTAEVEKLKAENAALAEQGKKASSNLRATSGELAGVKAQSEAFQRQNEELRTRLEELVGRYKELAELLRGVERERGLLTEMADDYEERVLACERNNDGLYKISLELIDRYEKKGFFTTLKQKEPFTQVGRAQIENMMDEYRYLAEQMHLKYRDDEVQDVEGASGDPAG